MRSGGESRLKVLRWDGMDIRDSRPPPQPSRHLRRSLPAPIPSRPGPTAQRKQKDINQLESTTLQQLMIESWSCMRTHSGFDG